MLDDLYKWVDHFEWKHIAQNYAPCRILDFGCGYGYSDVYLARRGFVVTGFDIDSDKIASALHLRDKQDEDIRGRLEFTSLDSWTNGTYDLVWASHVFEHVDFDLWGQIFHDFLRTGAPILISVPLGHAYDMPEHIHHWNTADELLTDLMRYSARQWKMWVDVEHLVIKANSSTV